jgi:hypothetical protein
MHWRWFQCVGTNMSYPAKPLAQHKHSLSARISVETLARLDAIAADRDLTRSAAIDLLVAEGLRALSRELAPGTHSVHVRGDGALDLRACFARASEPALMIALDAIHESEVRADERARTLRECGAAIAKEAIK